MIPYGSVVSWRVPPKYNRFFEKIFGYLQIWITGCPETHCSMIMSPYWEKGDNWYYEYELSITARINEMQPNAFCTIFDILIPQEIKVAAMEKLITDTYGNLYGLPQTLIFLVRSVIEYFGYNGKKIWNPFSFLGICSEGGYSYLYEIARLMNWQDLASYLDRWNPDVFHSGDMRQVLNFMVIEQYAKIIYQQT